MLNILLILFCGFLYLVVFLTTIFMLLEMSSVFSGSAPFVPADKKVITKIVEAINPQEKDVIYDLGCGDGRILYECYKKQPQAKYVGIEKFPIPYILAILKLRILYRNKDIIIKRKSFFDEDLAPATKVYTYLLPKVLDKMLPKIQKELKSGTLLVSPEFVFTNKAPNRVVELGEEKGKIIKKINIYEF